MFTTNDDIDDSDIDFPNDDNNNHNNNDDDNDNYDEDDTIYEDAIERRSVLKVKMGER